MAPDACANCGILGESVGVKLNSCSRCKAVKYCGKACQLKHWKEGGAQEDLPNPHALAASTKRSDGHRGCVSLLLRPWARVLQLSGAVSLLLSLPLRPGRRDATG